jgi:hypothetical protein
MATTYTPLVLKGLDLEDPKQLRAFQMQICDFLNAAFTASGISNAINGTALLVPSAMMSAANTLIGNNTGATAADAGLTVAQVLTMLSLKAVATDLGTVTTSPQTVACANAMFINVKLAQNIATGLQLNLTNLLAGAVVVIDYAQINVTSSLFQIIPSGVTTACQAESAAASVNMSGVGATFAQNHGTVFVGSANPTRLALNAALLS